MKDRLVSNKRTQSAWRGHTSRHVPECHTPPCTSPIPPTQGEWCQHVAARRITRTEREQNDGSSQRTRNDGTSQRRQNDGSSQRTQNTKRRQLAENTEHETTADRREHRTRNDDRSQRKQNTKRRSSQEHRTRNDDRSQRTQKNDSTDRRTERQQRRTEPSGRGRSCASRAGRDGTCSIAGSQHKQCSTNESWHMAQTNKVGRRRGVPWASCPEVESPRPPHLRILRRRRTNLRENGVTNSWRAWCECYAYLPVYTASSSRRNHLPIPHDRRHHK